VVIVGGGFGGLAAAQSLRKAPVESFSIDRTNIMFFSASLSGSDLSTRAFANKKMSSPIREIGKT